MTLRSSSQITFPNLRLNQGQECTVPWRERKVMLERERDVGGGGNGDGGKLSHTHFMLLIIIYVNLSLG